MSMTSKINRVYPISMVYMCAKFDGHNGLASIMFTWSKCEARTDGTTAALLYPPLGQFL